MGTAADMRHVVRGLMRSRGFAVAGALTLALGIAATTIVFSVVYGVLLRPLAYVEPSALVVIQGEKDFSSGPRLMNFSAPELEEFVEASRAFSSIALTASTGMSLRSEAGIEPITTATVSGAFFATLGTPPRLGRVLGDEPEPHVVISDRLWRRVFGGADDVVGRSLTLATHWDSIERPYEVVGVMPPEFQYPRAQTDVWRPLAFVRSTGEGQVLNRDSGGHAFIGRLRPGVSLAEARADAARAVDTALAPHFGPSRSDLRALVVPLPDVVRGDIGPALWLLMGAVGLILLVACANVANLVLARQLSRLREIATCMALGASRGRVVASVLAETGLVALAGCAMGVAGALGGVRLLRWWQPAQVPRLDAVEVDAPVLVFAALVACVSSMLASLAPAVVATRTDARLAWQTGLRGASGGSSARVRATLVVIEVAATVVLLVGAALLGRSLGELLDTDLGVTTDGVMTAALDLSLGRDLSEARQLEIAEALEQRVTALPSVLAAGVGSGLPPTTEVMRVSFVLTNDANPSGVAHMVTSVPASAGYFTALRIPLLRGRHFADGDGPAAPPVVVLNREAARRFFGDDDAIGRTLPDPGTDSVMTVIGVVENVKYTGIASPAEPAIYRPFGQSPFRVVVLVARTSGDPAAIAADLRRTIRDYDPDISIASLQPLTGWVSDAVAEPRFRAVLLSAIGSVALLLAAIGLYGVIACSVVQRTTEIGVRVALGARVSDVVRMVVGEGLRLAVMGAALGLAGAYVAARLLGSALYGVTPTDALSYTSAVAGLLLVALLACFIPARRAARTDPAVALRAD
jgi:putative ABC transport system permease protein